MRRTLMVLAVIILLATAFFAGRFFSDKPGEDVKIVKSEKPAVVVIQQPQKKQQEETTETRFGEIHIKGEF